jgi:hypothetical protein
MDAESLDGSVGAAGTSGGYTGRFATVLIEDALIGPGKASKDPWDPGNPIPETVFAELADALVSVNPYYAAAAVLGAPLLSGALTATQKPDCYGTMRMDGFGIVGKEYWLAAREQRTEDSFTPAFPSGIGFSGVPIDADMRLRVRLWDADLFDDDDEVGIAIINSSDMRAALAAQKKFPVAVWDQTFDQILFVNIGVQLE